MQARPPPQIEIALNVLTTFFAIFFQVFDGIECEWPFLFIYLALDGNKTRECMFAGINVLGPTQTHFRLLAASHCTII